MITMRNEIAGDESNRSGLSRANPLSRRSRRAQARERIRPIARVTLVHILEVSRRTPA